MFLLFAVAFVALMLIARKPKTPAFVKSNENQKISRAKKVFCLLFAVLSLSLVLGSTIGISSASTQAVAREDVYLSGQNVYLDNNQEQPSYVRVIQVNKIKNVKTNKPFKLSNSNLYIRYYEFRFYESKRSDSYFGDIFICYREKNTKIDRWYETSYTIYKHAYNPAEDNPGIYYYITASGDNSTDEANQYSIDDYSASWTETHWSQVFKQFLANNLAPILVTIIVGATFWAIILAINLVKAPDASTAQKFKTRLWHLAIGVFIFAALLFFLYWILDNITNVMDTGAIEDLQHMFSNTSDSANIKSLTK